MEFRPPSPSLRKRTLLLAALSAVAAQALGTAAAAPDPAQYNGFDLRGALVPLEAIEPGGPPRDGIPAIDKPKFAIAARASLRPSDRVLGLEHKGVVRHAQRRTRACNESAATAV